jgi:hypothetical protein
MTKLKVITGKVKKEYKVPKTETVLYYHEIPFMERKRIVFRHLVNGKMDAEHSIDMAHDFLKTMVDGWDNIEDEAGNALPFDSALMDSLTDEALLQSFLDDVVSPLVRPFFEQEKDEEGDPDSDGEAEKN